MQTLEERQYIRKCIINIVDKCANGKEFYIFDPYSERYLVSNYGNIKNSITGRVITPTEDSQGYLATTLTIGLKNPVRKTIKVHRVIARAFFNYLGPYEINHISGNKRDNSIYNLELMTRAENLQHARDNGLFKHPIGELNPRFRHTNTDVLDMLEFRRMGFTLTEIAKSYNTSASHVIRLLERAKSLT